MLYKKTYILFKYSGNLSILLFISSKNLFKYDLLKIEPRTDKDSTRTVIIGPTSALNKSKLSTPILLYKVTITSVVIENIKSIAKKKYYKQSKKSSS